MFEAALSSIRLMATNEEEVIDAFIYDLLDRYGITKADLHPFLEKWGLRFPIQVSCSICDEQCDPDKRLDHEQQPHVYYDECPYCDGYYHSETFAQKNNTPCKGHVNKCRRLEEGSDA